MPNIDERVVQMTFDNKQFEKNVSQSIKTLDDLKKALELDKMNDSLRSLEKQTSDVSQSMSALEATVDKVSNVFTPFGNLAYNALNKISNAALEAGENLLKMSLGIEGANLDFKVPGQAKYEAYTKAVQTITNATGKSVEEVSKVLDNLSKYTDETSYDFSEMVTSIGKFTSVGLDLERSEQAMEGIANWAAKAGAGKTKANQAMYNISQAMGAGAMKKIDWKSIEIASMATKEFKETAIETAIELGVLQDKGYGVGSVLEYTSKGVKETTVDFTNFAETLQTGWLNTEVLMATLEKYGDTSTEFGLSAYHAAQEALTFTDAIEALRDAVSSGWMLSLKYIFGDLDEARVMWTDFANALIEFSDIFTSQRNELLKGWHELGGYNLAVEAASNLWSTFMNIVLGVKEAFEDIFPPTTAENLVEITYQVEQFTEKLNEAFGIDTYTEVARKVNDAVSEISTSLREGIRADDVARLQSLLKQTGYLDKNFKAYGRYGKKTREAVEKLQKEIGVNVTGAWDEATKAAILSQNVFGDKTIVENLKNIKEVTRSVTEEINHASEIWQNLGKGDKNDWVRKLQQELVNAGYELKRFGVDGIYGSETEAAVKKLQQALGVEVTGAWDDATRAAAEAQKVFSEFNEVEETTIEKTKGLTSPMELIQNTVRIIAGAVKTVIDIVSAGLEIGWNVIRMFDPIIDLGWRIAHLISQLVIDLTDGIDKGRIIADVTDTILIALSPLAYVIDAVTSPLNSFLDGFQKFLEMNKGLANKKGVFFMLVKYLEHNRTFKRNVKNFKLAFKALKETVKDVFEKIKGVGQNIYDTIFGKNSEKKAKDSRTLITNFLSGVISIATWFSEKLTKIVGLIGDVLSKGLGFVNTYIAPFFKSIKETVIDDKVKSIGEFFTTLWSKIKNIPIGEKINEYKNKIVNFFDTIKTTVKEKLPTTYSILKTIKDNLVKVFGDFGTVFYSMIEAFKSGRIKNITDFFNELKNSVLNTDTGKKLHNLYTDIKTFIDNLKKEISEKGLFATLRDRFSNTAVGKKLTEIKKGVSEFFIDLKNTIKEKQVSLFAILKSIKNKIFGVFGDLGIIFGSIFEAFKNGRIKSISDFFAEIEIGILSTENGKKLYDLYSDIKYFIDNLKTEISERGLFTTLLDRFKNTIVGKSLSDIINSVSTFFTSLKETIKDKIKPVYDVLAQFKNKVYDVFRDFTSIFNSLADAFKNGRIKNITDFFNEFKTAILKTGIGKNLKAIVTNIKNFISGIKETAKEKGLIGVISSALQSLFNWDPKKNFFENITDKFEWLVDKIMTIKDKLVEVIQGIYSTITGKDVDGNYTSVFDKIKEFLENNFQNFNWKSLIPVALGGLLGFMAITSIGKDKNGLEGMVSGLVSGNFFKSIGGKLVGGVAAIIGGITLLSILPFDQVKEKLSAALSYVQDKLSQFVEYIKDLFTPNENGKISVLDKIVEALSSLKPLLDPIIRIKNKFVEAIRDIFDATNGENAKEGKITVFDRIKDFVKSLKRIKIGSILGPALGIATIYGIITSSRAFKNLSKGIVQFISGNADLSVKKDTFGDTALKIAGAIAIISLSLGLLSIIDADKVSKNIDSFIKVIAVMAGAMIAVGNLAKEGSNFGVQMLALAASIGVFAIGLKILADILSGINGENWGAYLGAGAIIVGLIVLLGIISAGIASASQGKGSTKISGLLQLCIGVGVLILAFGHLVNILEGHTVESTSVAIAIITAMIVGIGAISIKLAEHSGKDGTTKISGILGMCIGIAAIILAFGHVVSILDDVGIAAIIGSIIALGVIFAGMIILADKLSKAESTWSSVGKNIAQIAAVALAISLVMEAFAKSAVLVKDIEWTTLLAFAAGIAGVIVAVAHVMPILSGLSENLGAALKGCLIIVAIFAAIGASIDILAQFTADALTSIGSALWIITDDLAKSSSHINEVDWDALKTFGDYMAYGLPSVLFSATMLNGQAKSAHETMTEISEFGAAFHNYGTQIESITEDTLKSSGYAEQLATSAETIYTTLKKIHFTSGLTKTITDLGGALDIYYTQISGIGVNKETGEAIDTENLPKVNAEMISEAFSALAQAIPSDGTIDTINSFKVGGEHDLTDTALGIEKVGAALEAYGNHIGKLDSTKVTIANRVLNTFKGIYETFQNKDAFLALFEKLGLAEDEQTKVSQFSESITLIGGALGNYIAATENIDSGKIKIANGIISLIASIDQQLPVNGGFLTGLLIKKESLDKFGNNMSHLGTGVKEFANETAKGDYSHMNDALPAIQTLAEVLSSLDKVGGITGWVSGDKSLSAVTKGLSGDDGVGAQLVDFSGRMKDFKYSSISEAVTAIRSVIGLARQAGDTAYMDQNGRNKIEDIGVGIRRMLNEVASITTDTVDKKNGKSVIDGVAEIGPKLITAIIGGIIPKEGDANPIKDAIIKVIADAYVNILEDNAYAAPYSTIGNNIITAINSGVSDTAKTVLYTTLKDIATTGVITSFSGNDNYYNSIGNDIISAINTGVARTAESVLYNTLGDISTNGANEMGYKRDAYINTGEYLIRGLMIGIGNKADELLKLASDIGHAAHKELNRATGVHSPSKLFEWTGEMWGEGLIEGIKDSTNGVISSMTGMGENALGSMVDALGNGESSIGDIDGMLGGLTQNLDTQINSMMSGLGNFNIDDMVSKMFGTGEGTDLAINNAVQNIFNGFEDKLTSIFQDNGNMSGVIQSMISGIWNDATNSLKSSISSIGDPKEMILSTIQNAWQGITSNNANFTLKPVLDFENMSIGGGTASSIADYIKGINETNISMLEATNTAYQSMRIEQGIVETYLDVISNKVGILIDRTEEQTERINKLGNDMTQMKLVLSTGTLVGEIMPAVDKWLGKKSSINSRSR